MVLMGRYIINNHPNGEEICEYLRDDTLAIGYLIIPAKYRQTKESKEEARAKKYEYYLRRGLPIPAELKPKDSREEMEWKRLYDSGSKSGNGFNPQITMNLPPKEDVRQPIPTTLEETPKKQSKPWTNWFKGSK